MEIHQHTMNYQCVEEANKREIKRISEQRKINMQHDKIYGVLQKQFRNGGL